MVENGGEKGLMSMIKSEKISKSGDEERGEALLPKLGVCAASFVHTLELVGRILMGMGLSELAMTYTAF